MSISVSDDALRELVGKEQGEVSLYRRALTHRSCLRDPKQQVEQSNERLEYIGDAFLDLMVSVVLYKQFPEADEGRLSTMRARLVSKQPLAKAARRCKLGQYLRLSRNTERQNGRSNDSILADAFEAMVGALYLDQGYGAAASFVETHLLQAINLEAVARTNQNHKSRLQEHLQAEQRPLPTYQLVDAVGPDHNQQFTVQVQVEGEALGTGTAASKKEAEQRAANQALNRLHDA